jgi:hypothetical protein
MQTLITVVLKALQIRHIFKETGTAGETREIQFSEVKTEFGLIMSFRVKNNSIV